MQKMQGSAVLSPQREKYLLWVLMLVQFTTIVDFMIIMPLSSYLMQEMQITTAHFGVVVSAYAIAAGASSILASAIADRFDRRHALLFAYVGLIVATLACGLAHGMVALLVARALAGVFGGVLGSIALAIVGDVIPVARRGQAMSVVMLGFSLSAALGVPFGLFIAAHAGWRMPFFVLTGLCILVVLAAWRWVPPVRGHLLSNTSAQSFSLLDDWLALLRVANHWRAFLLTFLLMFSSFLIIPYMAPGLEANAGFRKTDLAWAYLLGGVATFFTRPVLGRLTDKYPYGHVLALVVLLACVPMLLLSLTLSWGLLWSLTITTLFFSLVSGRFIPAMAIISASTESALRGRMMAFNSAVQNFASGAAAFVAGLILQNSENGRLLNFEYVGALACVIALFAIWVGQTVKKVS